MPGEPPASGVAFFAGGFGGAAFSGFAGAAFSGFAVALAAGAFFAALAGAAAWRTGAFATAREGAVRAGAASCLAGLLPFPAPLTPAVFPRGAALAVEAAGAPASPPRPARLGRGPPRVVVVVSVVMVLFAFWLRAGEAAVAVVVAGCSPRRAALFAPSPADVVLPRVSAVELAGAAWRVLLLVPLFVAMGKDLLAGPEGARR
ncbi:MAG TPA: hypothetical protein VKU92_11830 [Acidimicrobiales bacterium]|nr:hypothetical protein [Acidimicrobiales bacterium]